jgi:hypothetical protein
LVSSDPLRVPLEVTEDREELIVEVGSGKRFARFRVAAVMGRTNIVHFT